MANRPGIFRQIWKTIMKTHAAASQKDIYIGFDENGNKYYERPEDLERGIRRVRRLEPADQSDPFHIPKIPVEWSTWLQSRRTDPPTQTEIEENHMTMVKTQYRAQELDKAHLEEKMQNEEGLMAPRPSSDKVEFPKYDDYEIAPGEPRNHKKKDDTDR